MDDPHVFPIRKALPNRAPCPLFDQRFGRIGRIGAIKEAAN